MKRIFTLNNNVKFMVSEKKLIKLSDGAEIKLRAPASFCFLLLLEKQGELVPYSELYDFGWQRFGISSSLNVLHNTIFYLRKSLSDIGLDEGNVIETIHRRGFIFSSRISVVISYTEDYLNTEFSNEHSPLVINEENSSDLSNQREDVNNVVKKNDNNSVGEEDEFKNGYSSGKIYGMENNHWHIKNILKKKKYFTFINLLITVLFLFLLLCIYISLSTKNILPHGYTYIGNLNQCLIYQNKTGYIYPKKIDKELEGFCNAKKYIYITSFKYSDKLSAIVCNEKLDFFSKDNCFSNYFVNIKNGDIRGKK